MTSPYLTDYLNIPDDFAVENYNKIVDCLLDLKNDNNINEIYFFLSSWKGFLYRFLACTEHDAKYRSMSPAKPNSTSQERYEVERELFNFLVNGLSAIECLFCALFVMGAIIEKAHEGQSTNNIFSMDEEKDISKITPKNTVKKFNSKFPNEFITKKLNDLVGENLIDESVTDEASITGNAKEYKEWIKIRNILTHRAQPGRNLFASGTTHNVFSSGTGEDNPKIVPDSWNLENITREGVENLPEIKITDDFTASKREWLTRIANDILSETYRFVSSFNVSR
ncbi:MAG TPA: hypothetical protein V6D35_06470 [Candidatus Sericytochromatia bacterium]